MNRSSRTPLLIIFITVFIDLLGFGIVLPLLPRYAKHFSVSGGTLGLLMASFSAMQFLFAPLWGRLSDRVGRRPILILGLAGSAVFYSLFGYATSLGADGHLLGLGVVPWLFICRICAGIAGATIPTAQAYIADVTGPKERAKGMALIGAAFGIGFTFGPLLGAPFVPGGAPSFSESVVVENVEAASTVDPADSETPPSAAPGYVAGVLSSLAMLSAIFLLPESLTPQSQSAARNWLDFSQLKHAVSHPPIGLVLATIFLTTFAFAQFESTLSLLTKRFGLADRSNYYVFAYIGFILSLSQGFLVRRLAPRLGEKVMCIAGTLMMTVGLLLIGLAGHAQSATNLYVVLPVAVVGFSAVTPSLQSLLSRHTAESQQGGILGLGQSISALARILGPWLGMKLFDLNGDWPYWFGAGMMAFGVLMTLVLRRPPEAPEAAGETTSPHA
ncbi:MAG: MFS transporter [Planctomycetes bacterium]|nr:MFS transporter [Planctomycetota bacterium]